MKSATATVTAPAREESNQPKPGSQPAAQDRLTEKQSESSPQSPAPTSKLESAPTRIPDEGEIRKRAYELYVEDGYCDGHQEEHWFAAERELSRTRE